MRIRAQAARIAIAISVLSATSISLARLWFDSKPTSTVVRYQTLDSSMKGSMEALRDEFFWWLVAAAIVVAAGVVLEGIEQWKQGREHFRGVKYSRQAEGIFLSVGIAGWALVAIGVISEFVLEPLVSQADSKIQTFDSILLTDADRKAGESYERAARLERDNIELQGALIAAKTRLEQEIQNTTKAQKAAAEALAARILPRTVKIESLAVLKTMRPSDVEIQFREQDPEAWIFAIRIRDELKAIGWNVLKELTPIPSARFGVSLPFWGTVVFSRAQQGNRVPFAPAHALPFNILASAKLLAAPSLDATEIDVKNAVLLISLSATDLMQDEDLPSTLFRIVVGVRDPTR